MRISVLASCAVKAIAVLTFARLVVSVFMLLELSGGSVLSGDLNVVLGAAVDALLVGIAWIYAKEIGQFAIGDGESHVAAAMRTSGLVVILGWGGHTVNAVTYWMMQRGLDEEVRASMMEFIGGAGTVVASVAIISLAFLFVLCSRPIGLAVARADRLRELRATID
jgi:hypothetical protein